MTIMRKDYSTAYGYRKAVKYWRDCDREIKRVPGGVQVIGDSFRRGNK